MDAVHLVPSHPLSNMQTAESVNALCCCARSSVCLLRSKLGGEHTTTTTTQWKNRTRAHLSSPPRTSKTETSCTTHTRTRTRCRAFINYPKLRADVCVCVCPVLEPASQRSHLSPRVYSKYPHRAETQMHAHNACCLSRNHNQCSTPVINPRSLARVDTIAK